MRVSFEFTSSIWLNRIKSIKHTCARAEAELMSSRLTTSLGAC